MEGLAGLSASAIAIGLTISLGPVHTSLICGPRPLVSPHPVCACLR